MSGDSLLKDRKFWPLFWTQFLGALNDNYLKNAIVMIITFKAIELWGMNTQSLVAFVSGIFILPFFLFSSIAGQLADKYEKSSIVRIVKWTELGIMALASYGFASENFAVLMISIFLMGVHSTFFGPIKYSIIPQLVDEEKLVAGNAYIETGTFIAILIGTIAAGLAASVPNAIYYIIGGLTLISALGLVTSYFLKPVVIGDANLKIQYNPFPEIYKNLKFFMPQPALFNSMMGISWFWFYGAAILSLLPVYTKNILGGGEQVVTTFLAMFTIGIAVGSIICEKLSFKRVELGLVPIGTLGMTIFLLDLSYVSTTWTHPTDHLFTISEFLGMGFSAYRIILDFFMLAIFGGIFTVPLYTLIQERSDNNFRSRVIATNNILNSILMVVASILIIVFSKLEFSILEMFTIFAILNFVASVYMYYIVPEFVLRFWTWVFTNILYRVKVYGHENVPKTGACILVCNHVSFVDWLIIGGAIKRPVRFVMHYKFMTIPLIGWFFRHGKVIPIAGKSEDNKIFQNAFFKVSEELQKGEIVCIFPEGSITTDGELQSFKKGIEHILSKDAVSVVPMALKGLWGSISSHKDKPAFKKAPKRFWARVTLEIGEPILPQNARAEVLEQRVKELLTKQ